MRIIDYIVIHCSASPNDKDIGFKEINEWHLQKGWKSDRGVGCGYHFIIRRNGIIEVGRTIDEVGSHVMNHNSNSIGVCLVGDTVFEKKQFDSLKRIIGYLKNQYPNAKVKPHNFFDTAKAQGKTCPNFDINNYI